MNCQLSKPLEFESFNPLELIGIWEQIHNPGFKGLEFETFRKQAGLNSFSLTPRKWIEATGSRHE